MLCKNHLIQMRQLMRKLTLKEVKLLEEVTIFASLIGVCLSLLHGNLYDYFFDLFYVSGLDLNIRLLYVSLLTYSLLAFVVFVSLFAFNETNPEIRYWNYVQGWLFITIAAASYEWLDTMITEVAQIATAQQIIEDPYTWLTKRASVILFGAVFVFWIVEKVKSRTASPLSMDAVHKD
jgi:hypothetical protein